MKLNPEDVGVTSFDTSAGSVEALQPILINDPTAATRCFICPPITYDRCY